MSPAPCVRLASDAPFCTNAAQASMAALAPTALHQLPHRLLRLTARRLLEGALPPRCYYWWNGGTASLPLDTRAL